MCWFQGASGVVGDETNRSCCQPAVHVICSLRVVHVPSCASCVVMVVAGRLLALITKDGDGDVREAAVQAIAAVGPRSVRVHPSALKVLVRTMLHDKLAKVCTVAVAVAVAGAVAGAGVVAGAVAVL